MKEVNKHVQIYYDEIGREGVLDTDTERKLSEKIMKGDERAAARLATANLRFVVHLANKYRNQGVDYEELVSEGNMALVEAAHRYDATHGNRFVSYAAPFIENAMKQLIAREAGIFPTPQDATAVEKKRSKALSVDAPLGGMENINLLSVINNTDSPSPEAGINRVEDSDEVRYMLDNLNERERKVISLYFGIGEHPLTMAEIGQEMGLKRERVRQIRDKAVRKMHKM